MLLRNTKFAFSLALVVVLLVNYTESQSSTPTTDSTTPGTTAAPAPATGATGATGTTQSASTAPAQQTTASTGTSTAKTDATKPTTSSTPTYVDITVDEYNQLKRDMYDHKVAIIIIGIFTFLSFVGLIAGFLYLLFKIPKITRF